ncbi:hypothetical protein GGF32_003549 [Allomyces javanicus]|nr:hypothetical protein GGF32_003549 [Allomyces javanicus]
MTGWWNHTLATNTAEADADALYRLLIENDVRNQAALKYFLAQNPDMTMIIETGPTAWIVLISTNAALLADIKERIQFYFAGLTGHHPVLLETATIVRQPVTAKEHAFLQLTIRQFNDWMCQSWPNDDDTGNLARVLHSSCGVGQRPHHDRITTRTGIPRRACPTASRGGFGGGFGDGF